MLYALPPADGNLWEEVQRAEERTSPPAAASRAEALAPASGPVLRVPALLSAQL
jgi:hypothetical protein